MTTLKENTELQGKVDEDEDDIDSLTEKNRQLVKQVCAISKFSSTYFHLFPSVSLRSMSGYFSLFAKIRSSFLSFLAWPAILVCVCCI